MYFSQLTFSQSNIIRFTSSYLFTHMVTTQIDDATGEQINYGELQEKVQLFACALCQRGLQKGDVVCLLADKSILGTIAFFGVIKAGGTITPCLPVDETGKSDSTVPVSYSSKSRFPLLSEYWCSVYFGIQGGLWMCLAQTSFPFRGSEAASEWFCFKNYHSRQTTNLKSWLCGRIVSKCPGGKDLELQHFISILLSVGAVLVHVQLVQLNVTEGSHWKLNFPDSLQHWGNGRTRERGHRLEQLCRAASVASCCQAQRRCGGDHLHVGNNRKAQRNSSLSLQFDSQFSYFSVRPHFALFGVHRIHPCKRRSLQSQNEEPDLGVHLLWVWDYCCFSGPFFKKNSGESWGTSQTLVRRVHGWIRHFRLHKRKHFQCSCLVWSTHLVSVFPFTIFGVDTAEACWEETSSSTTFLDSRHQGWSPCSLWLTARPWFCALLTLLSVSFDEQNISR